MFQFLGFGGEHLRLFSLFKSVPLEQTAYICSQGQFFCCETVFFSSASSLLDRCNILWENGSVEANSSWRGD